MHASSTGTTDTDILATAFKGNEAMTLDSDLLCDRLVLEQFLTVLHRLREDTHAVVESGPTTIELVGGYFLLIDPADSSSGFAASVHFAPPGVDGGHDCRISISRRQSRSVSLRHPDTL